MFIGRQSELAELEKRWQSGTFEFGVVYGTRRIGKTTLLQEFVKDKNAFYFQARKADEKDNLTAFSREFRKSRSLDEHLQYDSFDSAFDSIAEYAAKQRMILVIDEIAYLCTKSKALLLYTENMSYQYVYQSNEHLSNVDFPIVSALIFS